MKTARLALACVLLGLASHSLQAQALVNSGFENGLAGWQAFGDTGTQAGGTQGATQLWLTTAALLDVDDYPLAAGALNRSGVAAGLVGVPAGLENFVGLPMTALDPDFAQAVVAFEGSAARQAFTADAGTVLSFDWDFGTSDPGADYAFVVVDGVMTRLGGSARAALPGTLGSALRTGFSSYSTTLAAAGSHQVAFGVVDVNDFIFTSTLAIDNVGLATAVPEPQALWLALPGIAIVASLRRRTRRA